MNKKKLRNMIIKIMLCVFLLSSVMPVFAEENTAKKAIVPVNITVGKGSKYDFETIQEAVDSIQAEPTYLNKATISISPGVYEETVVVDKPYVVFKNYENDKADDVVITYDKANGHIDSSKSFGTEKTATVTIGRNATGFYAENITFQNSYNLNDDDKAQVQAVALVSLADKVSFDNCRFIGRQDTLYLKGASKGQDVYGEADYARVYLKQCYIEGTVDYIFGDATAYFDSCKLNAVKSNSQDHFTAANTTLFNLGYVFNNCIFTSDKAYTQDDKEKIDLARPWQSEDKYSNYGSQSVFLNCRMPAVISDKLFSLWSDETVDNKIRYYYYNLLDERGQPYDTSSAAGFAKQLSDEQAKAYSLSNVLRGSDNWNPISGNKPKDKVMVSDITLNKYIIDIPKDEKFTLKAIVLPVNAENKNVSFESDNEQIASVSNNGEITALKEGNTIIRAVSEENKFYAEAKINVIAAKTAPPQIDEISLDKTENILPGDILNINYTYMLKSDKEIDDAEIRWFAVNQLNNEEILLKEGNVENSSSYRVNVSDVGYKIKASVTPKSITSYGEKGETASAESKEAVKEGSDGVSTYLREGFDSFYETKYKDKNSESYPIDEHYSNIWTGSNSENKVAWSVLNENSTNAVIPECDDISDYSLLEYNAYENEKPWENANYELRMRFNPEINGLNAEAYFDFYTNYNGKDNSYYKFRLVRGSNTNSLKVYLYKKADALSDEVLIASDENSLANKIAQNSGEDNPWFIIKQTNNDEDINISITIDNESSALLNINAKDESPIKGGFTAFECYGKSRAVVLSRIEVTGVKSNMDDADKIRVYLAGDSTVKSYGDDNTIGGWGEFLPYYFDSSKVEIINKAEGGRSSRSFINQGRLDDILDEIREGDYLFIQFGHNDGLTTDTARVEHSVALGEPDANGIYPTIAAVKTETPQRIIDFYKDTDYPYSDTFYPYESGTFKWYLEQYVIKAREKGAIPIIVTPVARVFFDENGKITPHHGENDGYVSAAIQAANELNCNFVNMFEITKSMYEDYGVKVTQGLQNIKADGSMDITHYNKFGSNIVTSLLIKALAAQNLPLANYTVSSSRFVSKTEDLKTSTVYIIGDETVSYSDEADDYKIKPVGWANYLPEYFVSQIKFKNLTLSGASSKSYIKSSQYNEFINNLSEGDYVLIQFGLNDAFGDADHLTKTGEDKDTEGYYQYYLYNYYLKPAAEKKAVAFLVSPLSEMGSENSALKSYSDDVRALAADTMSAFINLYDESCDLYNNFEPTTLQAVYNDYKGVDEDHLNEYGARVVARTIIDMIKYSSATLKSYVSDEAYANIDYEHITKAEFMELLINAMGVEQKAESNFNDVIKGKEYYDAIGTAAQLGIAKADKDGNFYPESYIDRNSAIEAVKTAASLANIKIDDINSIVEDDELLLRKTAHKLIMLF